MARLLSAVLATILTIVAAPSAFACECYERPEDTDVVFFGVVTGVDSGETDRVSMEAKHIMEGFVPRRLEVRTPGSSDACGVDFKRGNEYFVHANRDGDTWTTTQCFGTREHLNPKSDAQQLREAGVPENKVAQLEKFQALAMKQAGQQTEVKSRFDTAPPTARYGHAKSPPSLEFLGAALERANELRPTWEADELAEKYLPLIYEDTPDPDKYADDVYRVLEAFYQAGDCASLEEHASKASDYTGPYRIQVDRWQSHCALIEGAFDQALKRATRLENRVGYDARTDDMLLALAKYGESRADEAGSDEDFAAFLRQDPAVRFRSRSQRMEAMDILTDLLDDTQLIRSPFVLVATADVVASLPESQNQARGRAIALLRAASLVEDDARKKSLRSRAEKALEDAPDVFESMEVFVAEEIPDQAPERDEPWSYEPTPTLESPPEAKAAPNPDPPVAKKRPTRTLPDEAAQESAFEKDWFILGGVALALVSLVLGLLSFFAKDED